MFPLAERKKEYKKTSSSWPGKNGKSLFNLERADCSYLTEVPLHEVYLAYTPELLLKNVNLKQMGRVKRFTANWQIYTALKKANMQ